MQENGSDQPRVYRRTRSMLKIRCTNVWQPRHDYSQLTENQKARFQTPYIFNEERNSVEHNSLNEIPSDLVNQTKSVTASVSDSIFSERKEEITRCSCTCRHSCTCTCTHTGECRGMTTLHSRIKKVNEEELWKASQCI